jgi:ribose 5-phosphate isomerase B
MTLNKHQGIRAALCWTPELGALAKQHNNANILSLPARFITEEMARDIVKAYITAEFEGGRHQRRIDKIPVKGYTCIQPHFFRLIILISIPKRFTTHIPCNIFI